MSLSLGAAAIIGGSALAGGATGGALSHHEAKASRDLASAQFQQEMDYNKNLTQIRVADALKAGINPLAALGQSSNVTPTIHAGGGSDAGSILASTGGKISGILQDYYADKLADDSESSKLDLEAKRLQNRILRQQIKPVVASPGEDLEPDDTPKMLGQKTLFTPTYDFYNRPRLVLDQNVMETDADNPGYTSSIIATLADAVKKGDIDLTSGKITNPQLRFAIDDFYYQTTGHHIANLEELYISPAEAAAVAAYVARGVS